MWVYVYILTITTIFFFWVVIEHREIRMLNKRKGILCRFPQQNKLGSQEKEKIEKEMLAWFLLVLVGGGGKKRVLGVLEVFMVFFVLNFYICQAREKSRVRDAEVVASRKKRIFDDEFFRKGVREREWGHGARGGDSLNIRGCDS